MGEPPVDLPASESGLLETDSLAMVFADLMRFCALDASNVFSILSMKLVSLIFALCSAVLLAHDVNQVKSEMKIADAGWQAQVEIECWALYPEDGAHLPDENDPDHFAGADWMKQLTQAELTKMKQTAETYLRDCFQLTLGGEKLTYEIEFLDFAVPDPVWKLTENGQAVYRMALRGTWAADASGALQLQWSDYSDEPLSLQLHTPEANGVDQIRVMRVLVGTPEVLTQVSAAGKVEQAKKTSLVEWIVHGFQHIIPKGLDHILFILGLFLLQPKIRPLLAQSTAFTIAHSITLGMVVAGWFTVPSSIVEPAIALSIAYVGLENMWVKELKPWRVLLIFALGLLHGMGFASVMKDLDIPAGSIFTPLLGFNIGVECGQLAVLLGAFLVTGAILQRPIFARVRWVGSLLIGLMGLYWTIERIVG